MPLCRVLRDAAVAHLRIAELSLDHPERVLHLRPKARLVALPALGVAPLALVLHRSADLAG